MFIKRLSLIFVFISLLSAHAADTGSQKSRSSAALLAQAIELLQKNEKPKALKNLERAFEAAADPDELREIATLLLEAAPMNYPKRDAYLRYLVNYNPDHEDFSKWLKELGDRAFEAGKIDEAEDWYLRALPNSQETLLIRYKMAWIHWNQKRKNEALKTFLEIFPAVDASLKAQIPKDIAKLWWEIGALAETEFATISQWSESERNDLLEELFERAPRSSDPTAKEEALLLQLKDSTVTKASLASALQSGFHFRSAPCFLYSKILTPDDALVIDELLACAKSSQRKTLVLDLIPFFEKLQSSQDERVAWTYAELLLEQKRPLEATRVLLNPSDFAQRTKEYQQNVHHLILQLAEVDLRDIYATTAVEKFEALYKMFRSSSLLERLQAVDPEHWLSFEEQLIASAPPKSQTVKTFLIKKGIWLAEKDEPDREELITIFNRLLEQNLSPSE